MNTLTLVQLNMILDEYHWLCDQYRDRSQCAPAEATAYLRGLNITLSEIFYQLRHFYTRG